MGGNIEEEARETDGRWGEDEEEAEEHGKNESAGLLKGNQSCFRRAFILAFAHFVE